MAGMSIIEIAELHVRGEGWRGDYEEVQHLILVKRNENLKLLEEVGEDLAEWVLELRKETAHLTELLVGYEKIFNEEQL